MSLTVFRFFLWCVTPERAKTVILSFAILKVAHHWDKSEKNRGHVFLDNKSIEKDLVLHRYSLKSYRPPLQKSNV